VVPPDTLGVEFKVLHNFDDDDDDDNDTLRKGVENVTKFKYLGPTGRVQKKFTMMMVMMMIHYERALKM